MEKKDEAVVAGFSIIGMIVGLPLLMVLVALFRAYIILDIAILFAVPFLNAFTLPQMIALNLIAGLLLFKESKDSKIMKPLIKMVIGYLLGWGMAYLIHWILL